VLPELSSVDPVAPLEEAFPPELTPDAAPLAEAPLGSPAHAAMRQHAAARDAERRMNAHAE
jgi:hypothetical protein